VKIPFLNFANGFSRIAPSDLSDSLAFLFSLKTTVAYWFWIHDRLLKRSSSGAG